MPPSVLDHPLVGERYFFPRADAIAEPFVVTTGGVALACHLDAPHTDAPMLLHFHGNGEVVADWIDGFAPALVAAGLNVCFAEYRGYGASTGTPALATMLDDAVAIADATGVPASRLFVYGRSVGSLYALHVAAQGRVAGLVIESGIADVLERLTLRLTAEEIGASDVELAQAVAVAFDHRAKLEAFGGRVLLLHATHDHLVSVHHANTLATWAGPQGRLVTFDRGDHNSIYFANRNAILNEVVRFVTATESA